MSLNELSNELLIFIINLNHRKDRLQSTLNELKKVSIFNNIKFEILEAYDDNYAKENMYYYFDKNAVSNIKKTSDFSTSILPTWGSAGCAISHIKCWERLINLKYSFFLIFEDDIIIENVQEFSFNVIQSFRIFKKNMFNQYLPNQSEAQKRIDSWEKSQNSLVILFNSNSFNCYDSSEYNLNIPQNYYNNTNYYNTNTNFLNYSTTSYWNNNISRSENNIDNLYKINDSFTSTHCYMINKIAANTLLNLLLPIKYQIDIQLGLFAKNNPNSISIYNFKKSGIIQNSVFESDVQYFKPEKNFLKEILNLSLDICEKISKYI